MSQALSPEERRDLIVSVGTHRGERRLSPLQVASLFEKARRGGATPTECAQLVGFKRPDMITRFLRLLDLSANVQELVGWGATETTLPFTAASEIARLPVQLHEPVARAVVEAQLGSGEVTQVVQRVRRSGASPEGAVEEILRLRPKIARRHVFIGHLADERLSVRLSALAPSARSELMLTSLRGVVGDIEGQARLTPTGFVISTDDEGADALRNVGDVESALAAALVAELDTR